MNAERRPAYEIYFKTLKSRVGIKEILSFRLKRLGFWRWPPSKQYNPSA